MRMQQPMRLLEAAGHPVDGAEVDDAQPAVVEQPEVARVRVGVQQAAARRAGEQEPAVQQARVVALLLRAVG